MKLGKSGRELARSVGASRGADPVFTSLTFELAKIHLKWMAAIAPWFCLRLPSCGPVFESQAHHLRFFNLY